VRIVHLCDEMEERTGFVEADGFGIGEKIEGDFGKDAAIEELIFCGPGIVHGAVVDFFGAGIVLEKHRCDVIGFAGVGESEKRARTGGPCDGTLGPWLSAVWLIFLAKV